VFKAKALGEFFRRPIKILDPKDPTNLEDLSTFIYLSLAFESGQILPEKQGPYQGCKGYHE